MKFERKSVSARSRRMFVRVFSLILALAFQIGLAVGANAQSVPCSPGPGGPPPGSTPRAIAKAPPMPMAPFTPIPGTWMWALFENRHVTLLYMSPDWPAVPANQIITIDLDTLPGFAMPASYELIDIAPGPYNIGYGIIYNSFWVLGRDPATGERRTQLLAYRPGTTTGSCYNIGQAYVVNPGAASIGGVEYLPADLAGGNLWALRPAEGGNEPGAPTPDQSIVLHNLLSGTAVYPFNFDEDQIPCAPGVNCPNWASTLIEQISPVGNDNHLLLRNMTSGEQRVGRLTAGLGFNPCGSIGGPCLEQTAALPAPMSGNALDLADCWPYTPGRIWVLWAQGLSPAAATPAAALEDGNDFASSAFSTPQPSQPPSYFISALGSDGAVLGSISFTGGGGGTGGPPSDLTVAPASIDFGEVAVGGRAERTLTLRNTSRADLSLNSIALRDPAREPFSLCEPLRLPYVLRPHEARDLRVCFQPRTEGAFQNAFEFRGGNHNQLMATVPVRGQTVGAGHPPGTAKLAGFKFEDRNGNGVWERESEPGIAGWRINLTGPETQTTLTDARGRFEFIVSKAGVYRLSEENRAGWRATTPASVAIEVRLIRGETFPEILFGNKRLQPRIQLPERLDFSTVPVGQQSPRTFNIKNIGDAELKIEILALSLSSSSAFSVRTPDGLWQAKVEGPFFLAPQQSATFAARFIPPQAGAFTDHLIVSSNDPATPQARIILTGTGFNPNAPRLKKLGIHLLHDRLVAPEGTLRVQPVIANQGNQPINGETIKVKIRIDVDEKAMRKFLFDYERKNAAWVKEYADLNWTATVTGIATGEGQNKKFIIEIELGAPSTQVSQPGAQLLLPVIPLTVYTPGTYGVTGSVYTASFESGVEGGSYAGQYRVIDAKKMGCAGGVWTIEGTISSWGFIVGGAKWEWKAKCASNSELEVVGVFYTGAAGVIFDLFPGEVKFKGVIEGAKSAADFSGWFSGVIGDFNASLGIVSGSAGGVYAAWFSSDARMRAMTWSGEVSQALIEEGVKIGVGNWAQDQADEFVKKLSKNQPSFEKTLCQEGKVEAGVKKFLSGKLCGFFGRSLVGGIE